MDSSPARGGDGPHGEALAQITTEIVRLYREYYGRGPTRAKSYMLDEGFVVTVVRDIDDDGRAHADRGGTRRAGPR